MDVFEGGDSAEEVPGAVGVVLEVADSEEDEQVANGKIENIKVNTLPSLNSV